MPTEFDDSQHYGFFLTGTTLTSQTGKYARLSELVLSSLRAQGLLDNMEDGTTAPTDLTKLWLDKNTDPAVLKEYEPVGAAWEPVTNETLFARVPYKGAWSSSAIYRIRDLVEYGGNIWIADQSSQNQTPAENAYWSLFIQGSVVADGTITESKLADNAVTNAKMADNAVGTNELIDANVTTAKLGDDSVTFAKLDSTAYDFLEAFSVATGNSAATNTTNLGTLEASVSGRVIDLGGQEIPVLSIPDGNRYDNGYWLISSYEGNLTASIPAGNTLPRVQFTLSDIPAYLTWAQDSGWPWLGQKGFFANIAENHGESYIHQVMGFRLAGGNNWTAEPLWGPDSSSALGYWCSAGGVDTNGTGGVQFVAIRAQNTSSTSDNTYELHRRHLGQWIEATDALSTVSTSSDEVRINRTDLDLRVSEGDVINFSGVDTVGGLTINGDKTVAAVFDSYIAFNNGTGNAASVETGGGYFSIRINENAFSEVTFTGGYNLGEALLNYSGGDTLTGHPTAVHDMSFIPGENSGSCYVGVSGGTGGWNVGIARLLQLERGSSEPDVDLLMEFTSAEANWTEPTVAVNPDDVTEVFVFFRTQSDSTGPGFGYTEDAFATQPTLFEGPTGWATKNPFSVIVKNGYIFATTTGNRGDTLPSSGHKKVPVFLLVATTTAAKASGWSAFSKILVGYVDYYDHSSDGGPLSVSPIGVGTLIDIPGGVQLIYGGSRPIHTATQPTAYLQSMKIDVRKWTGEDELPDMGSEICLSGNKGIISYQNAAAAASTYWKPADRIIDTMPGQYDPSTGYFTPAETGLYEFTVSIYWQGSGADQYAQLVNSSDTAIVGQFEQAASAYFCYTRQASGDYVQPTTVRIFHLIAGVPVRIKTTGTSSSSTVRNLLTIKKL